MEQNKPNEVPLNMNCPVCYKSSLKLRYITTDIPFLGRAFIMSIKCENCGFKATDTIYEEHKGKRIITITVSSENLGNLLVITGYSIVKIPELGLELEFKTENVAEITTIEGILMLFIDSLKSFATESEEERKKVGELIEVLEREKREPSGSLSIVVEDIIGKSIILSKDDWVNNVEKEREI